jgi:p-aminobenzoyl-glutamate transporter AbgT
MYTIFLTFAIVWLLTFVGLLFVRRIVQKEFESAQRQMVRSIFQSEKDQAD